MSLCPYCGQIITEPSGDHVFPKFLGGERTIAACRACNSKFGHTFEGEVARALEPIYVQLAVWGVPLAPRGRWWKSAHQVDGAVIDLSVGQDGLEARSSHPIILKDTEGAVTAAYFESDEELERFERTSQQRKPDAQWIRDEKRVTTNLRGLQWRFELGTALQQMALKMCVAASTLLANVHSDDFLEITRTLREVPSGPHERVAQYMHPVPSIWAKRPALAHTVYVEHVGLCVQGVVEFFGAFPLFVYHCQATKSWGHHAVLAYLDPVNVLEKFEMISPIGLASPPAFYAAEEVIQHQVRMVEKFIGSARSRGARTNPEVLLRAHLPDNPIVRL
jgi:hypothetical protein